VSVVERADPRRDLVGGTPVDFYVDYGLRVTINTDNRLMSDTTVTKELHHCPQAFRVVARDDQGDHHQRLQERVHAVREKADLVAEVSRELATYEDPMGVGSGRVGLVESGPPTSPTPTTPPKKPKLTAS